KHFVGYGAAEGGRDYDPVSLSQTELHNIYLPPFKAAVDAGVASIMSAYMDLNDVPPTADPGLLRDLLRARWGFQGVVISDASTIANLVVQGFAKDSSEAALRAIQAGVDVDLGSGVFLQELVGLVESGALPEQVIDDAVLPVLEMKVRMGLFDDPYVDERRLEHVAADPAHRTAARRAAQRSIVLLKNEGGVLPLNPTSGLRVAVVGPWADSRAAVEGIGDPFGAGPSAVTVLEAVRAKLPGAVVEHAAGPAVARTIRPFYEDAMPAMFPWRTKTEQEQADADAAMVDAVQTAQRADLVIAVVGETDDMSSEYSSRAHLDLPGRQQELLQHLGSLGKPVVVVLLGGRPLSVTWAAEHLPVLLQAWQLGHEGGTAIADVLFGEVNPGGKLPVTMPRSVGQVPIHYDRNVTHWPESSPAYRSRYFDSPTTPLFPFGFGLSYTRFSFSNLELSDDAISIGGHLTIAVELTNTGDVAGDEVAQLYIHQRHGRASRPQRQLKGFQRVTLQPAETTTVRFTLGPDELQYWSGAAEDFVQDVTTFDVWVGADSAADLHDEFSVTA
ncbi:glycoside hydrolase family 3 C-terminal domain-containing protein, partial [Jatrophihabitans endophyticus]|uniref:glycoside hydrolase family 3 C-terminal domain-containing protein n=1 Tax=Jatrophihabitans endophyticus TaxID=1206085 RepID=UPI0019F51C44